jgi:KDO2-lipid IV(A) lauroyltransferase
MIQHVSYFLARCVFAVVQSLSIKATLKLARAAGRVAFMLLPGYRKTALENLDRVYGETKTRSEKRLIALRSFQHFVSVTLELLHMPRLRRRKDFWQHVRIEGFEHARKALAMKKGVIFATGHTGNWELCGFASSILGIPFYPVAKPIEHAPLLSDYLMDLRRKSGMKIVLKGGALKTMVQALKDGAALAFIMDQNAGRHGVLVDFFGHKVSAYPSAAAMALKFGAPVVAAYSYRVGSGFDYRIHVEPIIEMVRTGDADADLQKNTQRIISVLEGFVRAHPEQWLWAHRRWRLKEGWFRRGRLSAFAEEGRSTFT